MALHYYNGLGTEGKGCADEYLVLQTQYTVQWSAHVKVEMNLLVR
jgi:hypothetical protein